MLKERIVTVSWCAAVCVAINLAMTPTAAVGQGREQKVVTVDGLIAKWIRVQETADEPVIRISSSGGKATILLGSKEKIVMGLSVDVAAEPGDAKITMTDAKSTERMVVGFSDDRPSIRLYNKDGVDVIKIQEDPK